MPGERNRDIDCIHAGARAHGNWFCFYIQEMVERYDCDDCKHYELDSNTDR